MPPRKGLNSAPRPPDWPAEQDKEDQEGDSLGDHLYKNLGHLFHPGGSFGGFKQELLALRGLGFSLKAGFGLGVNVDTVRPNAMLSHRCWSSKRRGEARFLIAKIR